MLKRKIYDAIDEWRQNKDRECLLVKGARQIGKTTIVREFGRKEYASYIEINFLRQPELKYIFKGSLEAEEILKRQFFLMCVSFPETHLFSLMKFKNALLRAPR